MKERGMIFNCEMVRALLDGRKTQTRRIMKPQPEKISAEDECGAPGYWVPFHAGRTMVRNDDMRIACPYGLVGDRIWVRETFQGPLVSEELFEEYRAHPEKFETPQYCEYAANGGAKPEYCDLDDNLRHGWRPSIHMPRWASRLTLEITSVRVERLNDISEEDARAEGIIDGGCLNCGEPEPCGCVNPQPDATDAFAYLWQSIYGQENWDANPWVWVIAFKRIEEREA